jgi:3-methyladenine DNA glycosylase AlkD
MPTHPLESLLQTHANPAQAVNLARFFKTGPGQYGAGDQFLGLTVPLLRTLAKQHRTHPRASLTRLLHSPYHEARLLALLILTDQYQRGDAPTRQAIYDLYLAQTRHINNWDLVDLSAPNIVGTHLLTRSRKPLYTLVKSPDLWQRRISILATFTFIRAHDYADTLALTTHLLTAPEDLLHKATGWMLREIGKRDLPTLETYLQTHLQNLPRTTLRYAIERLPEPRRQAYLKGTITP